VQREEYDALRAEIAAKLKGLADPTTGQNVEARIFLREEVYRGRHVDRMPDIVYVPSGECFVANPTTFLTSRVFSDDIGLSGFHRLDGVLIAKGPSFKKGVIVEDATLMDLAPTILYLLGSKVPTDMDGRILTELFEKAFLERHPISYREAVPEAARHAGEMSPEDQELILDRLKGLGYID